MGFLAEYRKQLQIFKNARIAQSRFDPELNSDQQISIEKHQDGKHMLANRANKNFHKWKPINKKSCTNLNSKPSQKLRNRDKKHLTFIMWSNKSEQPWRSKNLGNCRKDKV
eukprot:403349256